MPHKFIKELSASDTIDQIFHIAGKSQRTKKDGSPYYHLDLSDKTGRIAAKIWDELPELNSINVNDFAHIAGKVESYKGDLQIIVKYVKAAAPDEIKQELFSATSPKDIELLYEELKEHLSKIEDEYLLELVEQFLNDKEFVVKFKKSPAASEIHHAYVGGLLEHTVNLLNLAAYISQYYYTATEPKEPLINRDLLLTGIFLHDIGKIKEYEIKVTPQMTDEGRLLGHTVLGIMMVEEKLRNIKDFPALYKSLLEHLIGSHHGKYEYGAPVLPMIPEALVLHYIDNLDARIGEYQTLSQNSSSSAWTERSKSLDRRFYKPPALDDAEK